MKFLVVGLGSMGKRRIRNLQFLKAGQIIGFDPRRDRLDEAKDKYGVKTFDDFEAAWKENPDALIISTPPDKHLPYAMIAAENGRHFFTEAGVILDGLDKLIERCRGKNIVAAPSCTMRFQPSIKVIKNLLDEGVIGKVLSFTYHCGHYLPDWHPWEDYRAFYVSKKETGACREIVPFELVWLTWLLGNVSLVSCFKDKLTELDTEIDDVYHLLLKTEKGILGHLLVDVISRVPLRVLRLFSEEGLVFWDWQDRIVRVYRASTKGWQEYKEPAGTIEKGYVVGEEMYIAEMERFIKAIRGEELYGYTFEDEKKILSVLEASELSSENGIHMRF